MPSRRKRGQALVEFTLIVVILLLLMAGTVDVARLVTAYTYLNNAAQEGAIYGAMYPTQISEIQARVQESTKSLFPNPESMLTITVSYQTQPCPGHLIQVDVSAPITLIFPFAEVFLANRQVTLHTSAQQMILTSTAPACP